MNRYLRTISKSVLGVLRERSAVHSMKPGGAPGVLICPGDALEGFASDLRARALVGPLRELGWRVTAAHPSLDLAARRRVILKTRPNFLFFQQTRHPLNDPKLYPGMRCVFDIDDADVLDPRYSAEVQRKVGSAQLLVAGSHHVGSLFPGCRYTVSWTGTYLQPVQAIPTEQVRDSIVVWASTTPARYVQERQFVLDVFQRVAAEESRARFRIIGVESPDDCSEFARLLGDRFDSVPRLGYREFAQALSEAAVGLAPLCVSNPFSTGKSFGKVLGYLAAKCAIVATPELEYPRFFRDGETAFLPNNDPQLWAKKVLVLLRSPEVRTAMAERAARDMQEHLTVAAAARRVDKALRGLLNENGC